ncbi:protein-ADP-ribose hydrolase [Olsenella sp. KH3B4]|uniref:protein-ADP-ribose hydrolase n=1 Tax=Olsenella sp. KH3B4 TaxID=1855394 RepID=UPI0025711765|nr:protein-ADP-ribose hydrolase [Olsenella sp. KH3B4]
MEEKDMTQDERRVWLIRALCKERKSWGADVPAMPEDAEGQRLLLRALMNVRPPVPAEPELLRVQDAYLRGRLAERGGAVGENGMSFSPEGIAVWRGDITRLAADGIVNAANSQMLGCFVPNHRCIDNAIQTYAGIQMRLECARQMDAQGHEEPTGRAKITPGYNLPAAHVLHTVGPIVGGAIPSPHDRALLESCYTSCLELAHEQGLASLAFCCISTGEFGYPNREAAQVAVATVRDWKNQTNSKMKVIFDVFKPVDYDIYRELLGVRG